MKKETITAAAVLCALGAGFLACVLHTDQPLSLSERRPLAQRPEVSVQALASGNYMSEFETYALMQPEKHWITLNCFRILPATK